MTAKFTCVLAYEPRYCGPAALATIAAHYGLSVGTAEFAERSGTDLQGTDLRGLQRCAKQFGFSASCGKVKIERFDQIPLPAVVHYDDTPGGHFVVVHQINLRQVIVADPGCGVVYLSREQFFSKWSGYALLLTPGSNFRRGGMRKSQAKELARIAWGHKKAMVPAIGFAALATLLAFGLAAFAELTLDKVIPHSNLRLLYSLGVGALLLVAFRSLSTFGRQCLLATLGEQIELSLALKYTLRILTLPTDFFGRQSPSEIFSRLGDVTNVRSAIAGAVLSAILDLLLFTFYSALLLWYNVLLAAVVLCVVPFVAAIVLTTSGRLHTIEREFREQSAEVATRFIEAVDNIRTIKLFANENAIFEKIASKYRETQRLWTRRLILSGASGATAAFLTSIAAITVLTVGANLTIEGRLTAGRLIFFYSIVGLMLGVIESITPSVSEIQTATIALERLKAIESVASESEISSGATVFDDCKGNIELQDVSFWYRRDYPVLSRVSAKITAGECVAVLGETGSGKSTLACLVSSLYLPKCGKITIDGKCTQDVDRRSLRRHVGVVFHEPGLMAGTILENITFGAPEAHFDRIQEIARLAQAEEFILRLPNGYNYNVGAFGSALSSGQRQRLAIARALLRNPSILILDEATANLDLSTERKVMGALLKFRQYKTTLIITHRPSLVTWADRAIILHRGTIAEQGTHQELIESRGRYYDMVGKPGGYGCVDEGLEQIPRGGSLR
jgi:ATP-binding cassette, subfamily C, bacteriocin exporter